MQHREPIRLNRRFKELHMRFFWSLSAFLAITNGTRANDILPRCLSAAASRNNVIEG